VITFEKLFIGYTTPLAQVNIDRLQRGKVYAVIGSNGSGKSTFLKTISLKQSPFLGTVFIEENNSMKLNRLQRAATIAFVPTELIHVDFMTAYQFIALGRTPYMNQFGRLNRRDTTIVNQMITQLQLDHIKHKYLQQLSDGQRQLCALARALVQQTPIVLLDEPTNFLDYRNKHKIIQLLHQVALKHNLCIVFASHDIETIVKFDIQLIGLNRTTQTPSIEWIDKQQPFNKLIDKYYLP